MSTEGFQRITGFREADYATVRRRLRIENGWLDSDAGQNRYQIGHLEMPCLPELRDNILTSQRTKVSNVVGHVAAMHRDAELEGALFQVASRFNLLEKVSPVITPELGVTRYQDDHTQGPACAITAGAATICRNYFVPIGDHTGQGASHQLDALAPLAEALAGRLGRPTGDLWTMRNGYALCTRAGLTAIGELNGACSESEREALKQAANRVAPSCGRDRYRAEWIDVAIGQALHRVEFAGLDVRLVHFRSVPEEMTSLQQHWNQATVGESRGTPSAATLTSSAARTSGRPGVVCSRGPSGRTAVILLLTGAPTGCTSRFRETPV